MLAMVVAKDDITDDITSSQHAPSKMADPCWQESFGFNFLLDHCVFGGEIP